MNPILLQQFAGLRGAVAAAEASLPALDRCAEMITTCLQQGGKILAAGNGGSACDALHLCEELVGRYRDNRRALPAISLAADGTTLTCIGNDFGFDQIFARQVESLGRTGDLLVLFTTSGNSPNLLRAVDAAQAIGLKIVVFSGRGGGKLAGRADEEWIVPCDEGARVQELHGFALHAILEVVEAKLFT